MKSKNFITIQGWMRTELNLKGNDLLVYAIIYGFSQSDNQRFTGSLQYLADWCGATKQGIQKNLKNLLDANLIEKHEIDKNGVKLCEYSCIVYNSVTQDIQLSCTNNINNKQENNKVLSKDNTSNFQFGRQKPKKENLYSKCVSLILAKTDSHELRLLLASWLDMLLEKHKARGKQLYVNVFKGKLNMLDKYDVKDWKEIIEYNLQKGYEGFYPIPQYNNSGAMKRIERMEHVESMTEEDYKELEKLTEERRKNGLRTSF